MDENGDKRLQYHEFKEGLLVAGDLDVEESMLDDVKFHTSPNLTSF